MELDTSMVTKEDIIEYFTAIIKSILKIFGVEPDGSIKIGNFEIIFGDKAE